MKISIFFASPHRNGNTAHALSHVVDGIWSAKADAEITTTHLNVLNIRGCQGCNGCLSDPYSSACVIKDDMQPLYPLVTGADLIIFAGPVYMWGFSAQAKLFFDRLYCLNKYYDDAPHSLIPEKQVALVFTLGGDTWEAGPAIDAFSHFAEYNRLIHRGVFLVPFANIEEVEKPENVRRAEEFGQNLVLK